MTPRPPLRPIGLALLTAFLTVTAQVLAIALASSTVANLAHAEAAGASAPAAGCARVEVRNVRPQQGQLMVAAFADAESFGKKPVAQMRLPAAEATMAFELCGLVGDSVALTLFQDLDGDGQMGRNVLGIPLEPWGASGSPGAMGPSWQAARVPLDGRAIVVNLSL